MVSEFDNYFDRATVDLNCPLNHCLFHGGMTEKEPHLFFLSDISIYLS